MKLYAYDLDDTLIKSESMVNLERDGEHIELTPAEFAVYIKQDGDKLDFSQFRDIKGQIDNIVLHPMIDKFVQTLFDASKNEDIKVAIVTAREHDAHSNALEFFQLYFRYVLNYELSITNTLIRQIEYKGLSSSDPKDKWDHILGYIEPENKFDLTPIDEVYFYDDSIENCKAVNNLNGRHGAKVRCFVVRNGNPHLYQGLR